MYPDDEALAKELAEAFNAVYVAGWVERYPELEAPNLFGGRRWEDIHPDAQACWRAVARRARALCGVRGHTKTGCLLPAGHLNECQP
jgi:hypothetical protein